LAKVKIKNEWKIYAGLGVLALLLIAYLYWVSRPPMESGEYLWNVIEVIDERNIKVKGQGKEKQFRLVGLEIPDSQKQNAIAILTDTLLRQWVRIKPTSKDSGDVEEGFIFISGEDVHARFIRQGVALMSRDQKEIDIRPFIELEMEAKREKRGLWKDKSSGAK
jgi:endonuclease YncB( thermonuclease family)